MGKLRADAQSIIEYTILLVIVAVVSLVFVNRFLRSGELKLFSGYVADVKNRMR